MTEPNASLEEIDTLIVGGGLSGLYAASLLQQADRSYRVLEARDHLGGRIRTHQYEGLAIEFGPSWFWPETNPRVAALVEQYHLPTFEQHTEGEVIFEEMGKPLRRIPHGAIDNRRGYRLAQGSYSLVEALRASLRDDWLHPNQVVTKISHVNSEDDSPLLVETVAPKNFRAQNIILALPPRLIAETIEFDPSLPEEALAAYRETPTWMAGEAKFIALYDEPFWRAEGLSGTMLSQGGPLGECHDASGADGAAALFGFFSLPPLARAARGEGLADDCLAQLATYFGPQASQAKKTFIMDWSTEAFTSTKLDVPIPMHPPYGFSDSMKRFWNHRLCLAGTEADARAGGYLEGALAAAESAVAALPSAGARA